MIRHINIVQNHKINIRNLLFEKALFRIERKITVLNHERSSKQGEQQKICEPISNLGTSLLVNKSNKLKDK